MAAKKAKSKKKRGGVVEAVLVPVASTAIVATAAIHSLTDHRAGAHGNDGNGNGARRPPRPQPVKEPEQPTLLDKIAARLPFLKPVAAVQRRYGEVGGNQLAAALTLQAFLSLFPLILVAIAVLGFMAAGSHTDVAGRLVDQLGLKGESAKMLTDAVGAAEASRKAASVVGFLGLLWSGLGLVAALQFAYNSVWQVNDRGLKDKLLGLAWLGGATVLFVAGAVATTALRWLPGFLAPVGILIAFAVSFGLWLWTARVLPNTDVPWRRLVPGALFGAIGLEVLKVAGAYYVPKAVASSSQLYGSLGIVFAILAWLLIFGRLLVYSAVLNVVRYEEHEGTIRAVVEAPPVPGVRPVATRSGRLVSADS
ncbi:MAG TPA: YihY/virulence factor BrkB family protein [Acidimicrobiia bacterium]|nr:YihY/virulence factor BrkB family protein [Acidimicrobiia bacterium]